jgi:hypothetical protein
MLISVAEQARQGAASTLAEPKLTKWLQLLEQLFMFNFYKIRLAETVFAFFQIKIIAN